MIRLSPNHVRFGEWDADDTRIPVRSLLNFAAWKSIRAIVVFLTLTTSAFAQTCTVSMTSVAFGTTVNVLPGAAVVRPLW